MSGGFVHKMAMTFLGNSRGALRNALPIYSVFAFIAFFSTVSARAQDSPDSPPLAFNLATNRQAPDHFVVGEPVILYLNLTNLSDKTINLQVQPELQVGLHLEVRTPETRPWTEVKSPLNSLSYPNSGFQIQPYDTRSFSVILLYDPDNKQIGVEKTADGREIPYTYPKLVFDQESFFRLKAQLTLAVDGQQHTMEAGTEIEIKAPLAQSPEDMILGRLVVNSKLMEAYQKLACVDDSTRLFFERALNDFPANRYTPYFMYLTANSYPINNPTLGAKAENLFQRLLAEYPSFPLLHDVSEDLAMFYDQTGQSDKAFDIVQHLMNEGRHKGIGNLTLVKTYVQTGSGMDYNPSYWMLTP